LSEPRAITDLAERAADIELVEQCVRFASEFGIDHMLDVIAGIHHAYAPLSNSVAVRTAYEIAGIDLGGVVPVQ
jgi:hypothetical protein